jgi:hypothetical protein
VAEMESLIQDNPAEMPRKRMEEIHGFLNYVFQTNTTMVPYLIGFHMTIDSWRDHSDRDGWRLSRSLISREEKGCWDDVDASPQAAERVRVVPWLADDIRAITYLMKSKIPPLKRVRCELHGRAYYGFGDASGLGFGASFRFGDEVYYGSRPVVHRG